MRYKLCSAALAVLACGEVAHADPLYSVWTLDPLGAIGEIEAEQGKVFLEQRLLPYRLARLKGEAVLANGKTLADGSYLFIVYQNDGRSAFCTVKNQSLGSISKSLFIPVLDRRPCLVDADNDGQFEASFGVFDKYGSALTPSGNLSSAKPLNTPAVYEIVKPGEFPVTRRLSYTLTGGREREKVKISVQYDNGAGYMAWSNDPANAVPGSPEALNLRAIISSISDGRAKIMVAADPSLFLIGHSGGSFQAAPLPGFVR